MMLEARIAAYEGLVYATAARYAPYLDDDLDDVAQVLRVKVWKSLVAFNPARHTVGEKSWVFSCIRNQVKDILKAQDRRNRARDGAQVFVEDVSEPLRDRILHVTADEVYEGVEDDELRLPSTLDAVEVRVVHLLLLDFSQTEIAGLLEMDRRRVRAAERSVQAKMADWRPTPAADTEPSDEPVALAA
jgi:RNA polymerase sigma factor (sigma-70 family)